VDTQKQSSGDEDILSVDLRRYVQAVGKYKWLIAAIVAVAITGTVLYTNRVTPLYQATASIKIDPRLPDVLGQGQSQDFIGAGTSPTLEYYRAERQILQSYQLVRKTVEATDLHLKIVDEAERARLTGEEVMDLATRRLMSSLSIEYPEQNRIFLITMRSTDPALAATVANAHVATYVAYTRGQLSTGSSKASRFLASELDMAKSELAVTEDKLVEFQKQNEVLAVTLEDKQNLVSANITLYTEKLNDARAERLKRAALLSRLKGLDVEDILASPIFGLSEAASLDALKTQYYLERNRFLEISSELGPKSSQFQKQKAKVDDLYAALTQEGHLVVRVAQEQLAAAMATENALAAEVERYKQEDLSLGPKVVQYNQLQRTKKSAEDKYNIVVARLGTSDITSRIDTINVTPLDPARVPTASVYPDMQRNVASAFAIALVLGVGLALLLAYLDRSVKTAEDVQASAGAPVLGIIPMLAESELPSNDDQARDLYVYKYPTSRVAECCRSLRTNILFSAADRPLKTVLVSSANPREGKTTSVIYLGTTMAQSGQRVLLIDTDMRRPRLHKSTGVSRQRGLSNLIVGDASYDDVIKTTDIPNVYVLPCGPLPPNPAELLMTKRFETVLAELGERFDRIILDSPPLQAVTDAVVLSRYADGVILVVKAGKTLREEVKRSVKSITDVNGSLVGVILNELDIADRRYGYYYQYYSYGAEQQTGGGTPEPA
jgi:succinoglycan biosynthesis transport protein ExoP